MLPPKEVYANQPKGRLSASSSRSLYVLKASFSRVKAPLHSRHSFLSDHILILVLSILVPAQHSCSVVIIPLTMAAAIRQAPIVPSNARDSLWSEVEETKPCPPVLTARSANEQYPYASITAHQKPHFLPSSENSNLVTGGRNRRGHFALDYAGWRYQKKPRTAAEVDAKARELQRDFLTKPGYYNYRSKQSKKPPTKDDVWPDDAEWAFFQGKCAKFTTRSWDLTSSSSRFVSALWTTSRTAGGWG